jgi:hypothetical protein
MEDRISKLPKWAQTYIQELNQELTKTKTAKTALEQMLVEHEGVKPDIQPPSEFGIVLNGWVADRSQHFYTKPHVSKACTSRIYHSPLQWDTTTTQGSKAIYSSPKKALEALIPKVVESYTLEMSNLLEAIEEHHDS